MNPRTALPASALATAGFSASGDIVVDGFTGVKRGMSLPAVDAEWLTAPEAERLLHAG